MKPRRDKLGYTRDQRRAVVLAALAASTQPWTTSRQLRRAIYFYQTEANAGLYKNPESAAKGRLSTDLHALAERGLIEVRGDWEEGNSLEVRYALPRKHEGSASLSLTSEEHAALSRARRQLRPGVARVSPYASDGSPDAWDDIDKWGAIVRYLEETGEELSVSDIAVFLGAEEKEVQQLIELIEELDSYFEYRVQVSTETQYEDDEAPDRLPVASLSLSTHRQREPGSRGKGGLNTQGRFEYSLPETEERISLIEEARGQVPEDEWQLLWSAGEKLREWREILVQTRFTRRF